MNIRLLVAAAAVCTAVTLPGVAAATSAYTTGGDLVDLRDGPDREYRAIASLYPGTRVDVLGCQQDRPWCNVVVRGMRGWVFERQLQFTGDNGSEDFGGHRHHHRHHNNNY